MLVVGIITTLVVVIFWFFWYVPSEKEAVLTTYRSSIKNVQLGVEACHISGDLAKSGKSGDSICQSENFVKYPSITNKCGTDPYFNINYQGENNWKIVITKSPSGETWSCRGCVIECNKDECSESEECN